MTPLSFQDRLALRLAVSDAKRLRLKVAKGGCAGCGADYDAYSVGCKTCADRQRRRRQMKTCEDCGGLRNGRPRAYWYRDTGLCWSCYGAARREGRIIGGGRPRREAA